MKWLLLVAALSSFLIYGHAIKRVFSRDYGIEPRMKVLQLAGTSSAVVHLWAIWNTTSGLLQCCAALVIYTLAILVFFAAKRAISGNVLTLAFSKDQPQRLLKCGIYARIRHPFYTAYTITWVAGVVAAPFAGTLITAALMFALYFLAAGMEERKFAASDLAEEYSNYKFEAGMFWPAMRHRRI